LAEGLQRVFNHKAQGLDLLGQRLSRVHPAKQLEDSQRRLNEHHRRLSLTLPMALDRHQQQLQGLGRMLHQLSPLNVLERGYGIVQDGQGQALDSNNPPIKNMDINILLRSFEITSKVESVRPRAPESTPND
jgi:exodeoxyribonuclease VII large subunit